MSGNLSPNNIVGFDKVRINGRVNDEEYLEADFYDINEAWNLVNKPLFEALGDVKYDGMPLREPSNGAYDSGSGELTEAMREYQAQWEENKEADIFIYFEAEDGRKYEFEMVPRSDKTLSETEKPFSFIQLKHNPSKNRCTGENGFDSVQRMALRNAMDYSDDYLERTPVGHSDVLYEMDLLTAFDRDGGVWDQFDDSEIPFSQVLRTDFRQVPSEQPIDFPGVEDSAPYIARFVTDEIQDAGISNEDARTAGRHIGTTNALGLSFEIEREEEELKLDYDPRFGESMVLIDPEFARYTDNETDLDHDFNQFNQQILPKENWRKIDENMRQSRNDILYRTEGSSKDWKAVIGNQLPENWRSELPDERVVHTNL